MTRHQRRKRRIVARLVYMARWRRAWQRVNDSSRRLGEAMAEVYRQGYGPCARAAIKAVEDGP